MNAELYGPIATVAASAFGLIKYWRRTGTVTELSHAQMVKKLIELRKEADQDLRAMTEKYTAALERRGEDEALLRARIISLEAKLEAVERFMPDMLKLASAVSRRIEEARSSRVKDLAPGVQRVEESPATQIDSPGAGSQTSEKGK